jgi:hypothetical protein
MIGGAIGVALALLIGTARYVAYRVDPDGAAEGGTFIAFIAAELLGAPLNLAIGRAQEPLRATASSVLGRRVSYFQLYYGGLVVNWTLLGFLYGVWRTRRRHAPDHERRE